MSWTLNMSDESFIEALKQLTREERIKVMAELAKGWHGLLKSKGKRELARLEEKLGRKLR